MKIYQKPGFNRLAKLITVLGFFVTYITLIVTEYGVNEEEAFIEFPILSIIVALVVFLVTRLVYWVFDGFLESKDESL